MPVKVINQLETTMKRKQSLISEQDVCLESIPSLHPKAIWWCRPLLTFKPHFSLKMSFWPPPTPEASAKLPQGLTEEHTLTFNLWCTAVVDLSHFPEASSLLDISQECTSCFLVFLSQFWYLWACLLTIRALDGSYRQKCMFRKDTQANVGEKIWNKPSLAAVTPKPLRWINRNSIWLCRRQKTWKFKYNTNLILGGLILLKLGGMLKWSVTSFDHLCPLSHNSSSICFSQLLCYLQCFTSKILHVKL